jgi:hypothetical protein
MSNTTVDAKDILDPNELEAFVARRKAAWRAQASNMSWEEKVAAIERMWARDASLKVARDANTKARLEKLGKTNITL